MKNRRHRHIGLRHGDRIVCVNRFGAERAIRKALSEHLLKKDEEEALRDLLLLLQ